MNPSSETGGEITEMAFKTNSSSNQLIQPEYDFTIDNFSPKLNEYGAF